MKLTVIVGSQGAVQARRDSLGGKVIHEGPTPQLDFEPEQLSDLNPAQSDFYVCRAGGGNLYVAVVEVA